MVAGVHGLLLLFFRQTLRFEGVAALYKGFVPSYLRLGPWNIIVSLHCWVGWGRAGCKACGQLGVQ